MKDGPNNVSCNPLGEAPFRWWIYPNSTTFTCDVGYRIPTNLLRLKVQSPLTYNPWICWSNIPKLGWLRKCKKWNTWSVKWALFFIGQTRIFQENFQQRKLANNDLISTAMQAMQIKLLTALSFWLSMKKRFNCCFPRNIGSDGIKIWRDCLYTLNR